MYSYKKKISDAMAQVMEITAKRRILQNQYNIDHDITPTTIFSKIKDLAMT